MNTKNLNGWAISTKLYQWINANLEDGKTILELGSGTGTIELTKKFKVYSIEHNENWLNLAKDANYIYAPIQTYDNYRWYSLLALKTIKGLKYDMILVDGPPGDVGREGFFYNLHLFNTDVPIILDDTNRGAELNLARSVAEKLNKKMKHFKGPGKNFIVINDKTSQTNERFYIK